TARGGCGAGPPVAPPPLPNYTTGVDPAFSFRRFGYALGAMFGVLVFGSIAFHATLHESWLQSFYRAVVSSSLTGLDTVPPSDSARIITIVLVLAGITIFAYVGSLLVEAIARG